ncbi:MAG: hypothetical protein ABW219_10910 [Ilumatobacteraceae bacterium]
MRESQWRRLQELTASAELLRAFERSLVSAVGVPSGFDVAVRDAASERHMESAVTRRRRPARRHLPAGRVRAVQPP